MSNVVLALADWRSHFLGARGPKSSATRMVLVALAHLMERENTLQLSVTAEVLTGPSAMSVGAIWKHLGIAEREGWLVRHHHPRHGHGRAWKTYEYQPAVPTLFHVEQRPLRHIAGQPAA